MRIFDTIDDEEPYLSDQYLFNPIVEIHNSSLELLTNYKALIYLGKSQTLVANIPLKLVGYLVNGKHGTLKSPMVMMKGDTIRLAIPKELI